MTQWAWQQDGWPDLSYDTDALRPLEDQFIKLAGTAIGSIYHLSTERKAVIQIHLLEEEIMDTSAIEGEVLDRASVRSSIRRHLGLPFTLNRSVREAGITQFMTEVAATLAEPLCTQTLCDWQKLVVAGSRDVKEVGRYRTHPAEMQIISGPISREKIHFVAPPSATVPAEMERFLAWFNSTTTSLPALARAGIAHFWFETIHPFEDGNGRIGRAISLKSLGQAIGTAPIAMLSETLLRERNTYYDRLNEANRGEDLNKWLAYFAQTIVTSQERTIERILFTIARAQFLDSHQAKLNPRQAKAITKMFEAGPDGFQGGLSASNYMSITQATEQTTTRDLKALVGKGILKREGEKRYTRYYLNV